MATKATGNVRLYYRTPRALELRKGQYAFTCGTIGEAPGLRFELVGDYFRESVEGWVADGNDYYVPVPVVCKEFGVIGNVAAGKIDNMIALPGGVRTDVVLELREVSNPEPCTGGTDDEKKELTMDDMAKAVLGGVLPAVGRGRARIRIRGALPFTRISIYRNGKKPSDGEEEPAFVGEADESGACEGVFSHSGRVSLIARHKLYTTTRELELPPDAEEIELNLQVSLVGVDGQKIDWKSVSADLRGPRGQQLGALKRKLPTKFIIKEKAEVVAQWDQRGYRKLKK